MYAGSQPGKAGQRCGDSTQKASISRSVSLLIAILVTTSSFNHYLIFRRQRSEQLMRKNLIFPCNFVNLAQMHFEIQFRQNGCRCLYSNYQSFDSRINSFIQEFLRVKAYGEVSLTRSIYWRQKLSTLGLWVIERSDGLILPCHQEPVECPREQLLAKLQLFFLLLELVDHRKKWNKLDFQLRSTPLIKQMKSRAHGFCH